MSLASNIKIVLVKPSHSGNIGSVARAMKNMGLTNLTLVAPQDYDTAQAKKLAMHAKDVLFNADIVPDLDEAIAESELILAASGKVPKLDWPCINSRDIGAVLQRNNNARVAIIFGTESSGLSSEELQRCHYRISIPCGSSYDSLNLAQAVLIVAYEINLLSLDTSFKLSATDILNNATDAEVEGLMQHLRVTMEANGFLKPDKPRQLMGRLRRLFLRASLDKTEVNILRGFLRACNDKYV